MATAKMDAKGVYEPLFCDRIEIPMKLVIDVTDNPSGLKEETAELLRRCLSPDEGVSGLALEDLVMAFIAESPASCTMSYGTDSAEAIENLRELGALDAEPSDEISNAAAEARYTADVLERKAKRAAALQATTKTTEGTES